MFAVREIQPLNIFMASVVIWVVSYAVIPVTYWGINPALPALLSLLFFGCMFAAGAAVVRTPRVVRTHAHRISNLKALLSITSLLGLIGCALRFKNRTSGVIAGIVAPGGSALKAKMAALDAGELSGGFVGVLAAIFTS